MLIEKPAIVGVLIEDVGKSDREQANEDQPGNITDKVDEDDRDRTDGQQQKTTLGKV